MRSDALTALEEAFEAYEEYGSREALDELSEAIETIRQALKSLEDERDRLSSAYDQLAMDFESRGKLLDEVQAERDRCHRRLEIDRVYRGENLEPEVVPLDMRHKIPDGIECRNDTIWKRRKRTSVSVTALPNSWKG